MAEGFDVGNHDISIHLIDRLLILLPSLVDIGAASDVKCHAKDFDPLEPTQAKNDNSWVFPFNTNTQGSTKTVDAAFVFASEKGRWVDKLPYKWSTHILHN